MRNDILTLREVIKKLVPILTKKGLRVTQMGAEAYVCANPKTHQPEIVNIPSVSDEASPDFIRAIQGFVDHEVAHVLLTDFTVYGKDPKYPDQPATKKFVDLHNAVEDTMIEREIVKIFPGSKKNIATTRRYFLENVIKSVLKDAKTPQEQYQYLLVVILRALAGHEEMQEFMDKGNYWKNSVIEKFVNALDSKTKQALKICTTTKETLQIALDIADIMERHDPSSEAEQFGEILAQAEQEQDNEQAGVEKEPEENKPNEDAGDKQSNNELENQPNGNNKNKTKEGGKSDSNEQATNQDKAENSIDDTKSENKDKDGSQSNENNELDANDISDTSDGNIPSTYRLDGGECNEIGELVDEEGGGSGGVGGDQTDGSIFDVSEEALEAADISKQIALKISQESYELLDSADYSVFTRDFDKIEPLKTPDKINGTWISAMQDETRSMVGVMQKSIERALSSQSMVANVPGFKRGRLHAPSLYRLNRNDPRIFSQRFEAKAKDTAVTLLIDNSGSMLGEKMRLAMLATYALAETLEKVRIKHEVLGFTTMGYDDIPRSLKADEAWNEFDRVYPIAMPIYKDFNERINATVRKRIAYAMNAQDGLHQNIDGESLLYAVDRLSKQREKRKVVIVLSDGQPAGAKGAAPHLRHVVKKIEASGIECIGIGIMSDAVELYYSKHIVLEELEALPALVMQQLQKILTN